MTQKLTRRVLSPTQTIFFKTLNFVTRAGLYLAGGTALALHLNHRRSVDFDFYTQKHFPKGTLINLFRKTLSQKYQPKVVRDFDDTFEMNVEPDIHVSCFFYAYPLIESPTVKYGAQIASLKDIAAMKLVAIAQRGRRRDFIDFFYLLKYFTLGEILRFTSEKYPEFDEYHGLRGLVYFKDADDDPALERAVVFDRALTWTGVKSTITKAVRAFHTSLGKK